MNMTKHAGIQSQQRNIPKLAIAWIKEFGHRVYDHRGGVIRYLDKAARRKLEKAAGIQVVNKLEQFLNCYLVEDCESGVAITVGHHYERFRLA
jgi:hypothetical protein